VKSLQSQLKKSKNGKRQQMERIRQLEDEKKGLNQRMTKIQPDSNAQVNSLEDLGQLNNALKEDNVKLKEMASKGLDFKQKLKAEREERVVVDAKVNSLEDLVRNLRAEVNALKDDGQQKEQQLRVLMEEKKVMMQRNQEQSEQIAVFADEEKEKEMELQGLREEVKRLKLQSLDESKYVKWGPDEIAAWIINLDKERMGKYEESIKVNLKKDNVRGSLLSEVDGGDLGYWGIDDFSDRKFVQKEITKLVTPPSPMANEGANPAPTAFM